MFLSTYDKFSNAIENKDISSAESILGYSDIRCELLSSVLNNHNKDIIRDIINSFTSRGLKEQALTICDNCSVKRCKIKDKLSNIIYARSHYSSEENILINKQNRMCSTTKERRFNIHSGEYIEDG